METQTQQPSQPQEEQSQILNQEEIQKTLSDEPITEEVTLPSDTADFSMPSKFEGKSAEEIARAYVELEKYKNSKQSEETPPPTEETPPPANEVQPYIERVLKGEELTEEDYTTLQEKTNMSKEQIDEQLEYIKYKSEKEQNKLLESVGGKDKFNSAVAWAREVYTQDEIKAYNEALAEATPEVQKVIIKGLINQYDMATKVPTERVLHSNTAPTPPGKGYKSQHELMKDMSDPRYGSDRSYTKMVEKKMSITDDSKWD